MKEHFKVVCGTCKCDPVLTSDGDRDGEMVVCPGCGQRDIVDEAFRIAGEYHVLRTLTPKHMPLTEQTFKWHAVIF